MNHCNRARPASPALYRLRATQRQSRRVRKLSLLRAVAQTLSDAGLMNHDPLTPAGGVRHSPGKGI